MAGDAEVQNITVGNAVEDGKRGWFIGQFVPPAGELRKRDDIEIKWGVHPAGDVRARGWSIYRAATTITILLEGVFVILLRGPGWKREVKLERKGDYVIFKPGVEHSWHSEVDSLVLTIRTPSIPDDQENFES